MLLLSVSLFTYPCLSLLVDDKEDGSKGLKKRGVWVIKEFENAIDGADILQFPIHRSLSC